MFRDGFAVSRRRGIARRAVLVRMLALGGLLATGGAALQGWPRRHPLREADGWLLRQDDV